MLYAPAQVNGKEVISIYGVNGQPLLLNTLDMIGDIVHLPVKIIVGKGAASDGILTVRLHHKADALHFVQQSVCFIGKLVLQFITIERNYLIEVNFFATRQDANLAAILCTLRSSQHSGTEICIFCKILLIIHGMSKSQPGVTGNGQASQCFQQTYGPVPLLIFEILFFYFPIFWQSNGKLCSLQLVFCKFLWHIHSVNTHPHSNQCVVISFFRRRNNTNIHMYVR